MNMAEKTLESILKELSEEDRRKLEDFANYLREKHGRKASQSKSEEFNFDRLEGLALKAPLNPNPQFNSEDDLWE